ARKVDGRRGPAPARHRGGRLHRHLLPAHARRAAHDLRSARGRPRAPTRRGQGMKILLVEDDDAIGTALQRGLTEEGHTVDWCTRGLPARDQAQQIDYDVIVLDWALPDYDGLHLLRDWRGRGLH